MTLDRLTHHRWMSTWLVVIAVLVSGGAAELAHAQETPAAEQEIADTDTTTPRKGKKRKRKGKRKRKDKTVAAVMAESAESAASAESSEAEVIRAVPRKRRSKRVRREAVAAGWETEMETRLRAGGGALSGQGPLDARAAFVSVDADLDARIEHGRWSLDVPFAASHRTTQGSSLSQSSGKLGAELEFRPSRALRVAVLGKVTGVWRPDWPDLYQPMDDGALAGTDRRSYWSRAVGTSGSSRVTRRNRLSATYEHEVNDYRQDPSFDEIEEPLHLVPGDFAKHEIDLSWRYIGQHWKLGLGAELFDKRHAHAFARDAHTGATHATSTTMPANPRQHTRGAEPSASVRYQTSGERLTLEASYGYELVQDTFQGYYSYTGHHPAAGLAWSLLPGFEVGAKSELFWRVYGPNSYAADEDHPPLLYGDRRVDRRLSSTVHARAALGSHWALQASWELDVRRTNFPPYEPGVFPASRNYDIDWNYENWMFRAGIEYRQ